MANESKKMKKSSKSKKETFEVESVPQNEVKKSKKKSNSNGKCTLEPSGGKEKGRAVWEVRPTILSALSILFDR